ncbi:MAG: SGNH/GDSL hydrolase family protein [Lentisphaeria bacterium]|nr:SGNH/GDSL hydrolase family protein [Lentisphaeria bacterium]
MIHSAKTISVLGMLCCVLSAHAVTPFRDGEKVVFLGDSITHGGWFICWAQAIYQLRCPGKIVLDNAGIAGNSAGEGLARLEYDVLDKKPDRVFVMFGMNDLGLTLYAKGGMGPDAVRRARMENYEKNINRICEGLKEAGIPAVLITPTPYNQYGKDNPSSYNEAGLAAAAGIIRKTAEERGLEVLEFHAPMTEILKKQPEISPMRADNVHPNELGHLVMAYYLCKAAGLDGKIADVSIDAADGKILKAEHAVIRDVKIPKAGKQEPAGTGPEGISFEYCPSRLPFIMDKRHEGIDSLVPFTEDFNTESMQITGLAEGEYQILADGVPIGTFSSADLAKGINLAVINTPSRQQARKVFRQIEALRTCMSRLRSVVQGDRFALSQNADLRDPESCCKAADQWFKIHYADEKASGRQYYANVVEEYKKNKRILPDILKQMAAAYENLYRESHAVSYRIELKKL